MNGKSNIRLVIWVLASLTATAMLGTVALKMMGIDVPASFDDVIKMGLTAIGTILAREALHSNETTTVTIDQPANDPIPVKEK